MAQEPIAYTYEADVHCPPCASRRFGTCPQGFIACSDGPSDKWPEHPAPAQDAEGNPVGAIAPWDEWCNPQAGQPCVLACGTCGDVIRTHEWLEAHA